MEGKTLYRNPSDQMIGGVCSGIADHFEIDPTVIRLLAVFLLLIGNVAIVIAYIVLMVVVPEAPKTGFATEGKVVMAEETGPNRPGPDSPPPPPPAGAAPPPRGTDMRPGPAAPYASVPPPAAERRAGRGPVWFGVALIFVGSVLLLQMFIPQIALWQFWPVIIIVAGLLMIFRRGR